MRDDENGCDNTCISSRDMFHTKSSQTLAQTRTFRMNIERWLHTKTALKSYTLPVTLPAERAAYVIAVYKKPCVWMFCSLKDLGAHYVLCINEFVCSTSMISTKI